MSWSRSLALPLLAMLVCWLLIAFWDRSRGRMGDLVFDVAAITLLALVTVKAFIDPPSESESQRRISGQLNRP